MTRLRSTFDCGRKIRCCRYTWELGRILGKGTFGVVRETFIPYERRNGDDNDDDGRRLRNRVRCAVKIERLISSSKRKTRRDLPIRRAKPLRENVERLFFVMFLRRQILDDYKKTRRLAFLGLPTCVDFGSTLSAQYIVMERLGPSINDSVLAKPGRLASYCTQIVDALVFLHTLRFAHMDIKPANLLLAMDDERKVFLTDFGLMKKFCDELSVKYDRVLCDRRPTWHRRDALDGTFEDDRSSSNSVSTIFETNSSNDKNDKYARIEPLLRHDGTLLYSSRDNHFGHACARADLETLCFNILEWLGVKLPWTEYANDRVIYASKFEFVKTLTRFSYSKISKDRSTSLERVAFALFATSSRTVDEKKINNVRLVLEILYRLNVSECTSNIDYDGLKRILVNL